LCDYIIAKIRNISGLHKVWKKRGACMKYEGIYATGHIYIHTVHNVHSMKVEVEIAYLVSFCQELT
jgi:hypothetical protein